MDEVENGESKRNAAPPEYSDIGEQFGGIEDYAEACGIEDALEAICDGPDIWTDIRSCLRAVFL